MNPRQRIRHFISDTFFVDQFSDQDSFLTTGVIDSTGMVELIMFVEDTFSISIKDDELLPENLDSLDNLCSFIERKATAAA